MATAAIVLELTTVQVIIFVTGCAGPRCITQFLVRIVARHARQSTMSAFKIEVRTGVIKGGAIELDDVGRAPEMFAVTRLALRRPDILHPSV